jgi:hypothetical protein
MTLLLLPPPPPLLQLADVRGPSLSFPDNCIPLTLRSARRIAHPLTKHNRALLSSQFSVFFVCCIMQSPRVVQVAGGGRGGKAGGQKRGGKAMTLSERFALLKKAATSPNKPGQQGVQKQTTPNKQGQGKGKQGNAQAKGGNAQAKGGQAGGKKGKKGGKGKGGKPVDHATLDQQLETHMAEGGDGAAAQ